MAREGVKWETAVTRAVDDVGLAIKNDWRGQIVGAGLGDGLAFSVRSKTYPDWTVSANAATEVKSDAGDILTGHDEGSLIRSKEGFWLAIPLPAAGRRARNSRPTPAEWERQSGLRLRFVFRPGRSGLLVTEGGVSVRTGRVRGRKRLRLKSGAYAKNVQSIAIFVLVPQVKLPKRLDLMPAARAHAARLDAMIVRHYERIDR